MKAPAEKSQTSSSAVLPFSFSSTLPFVTSTSWSLPCLDLYLQAHPFLVSTLSWSLPLGLYPILISTCKHILCWSLPAEKSRTSSSAVLPLPCAPTLHNPRNTQTHPILRCLSTPRNSHPWAKTFSRPAEKPRTSPSSVVPLPCTASKRWRERETKIDRER